MLELRIYDHLMLDASPDVRRVLDRHGLLEGDPALVVAARLDGRLVRLVERPELAEVGIHNVPEIDGGEEGSILAAMLSVMGSCRFKQIALEVDGEVRRYLIGLHYNRHVNALRSQVTRSTVPPRLEARLYTLYDLNSSQLEALREAQIALEYLNGLLLLPDAHKQRLRLQPDGDFSPLIDGGMIEPYPACYLLTAMLTGCGGAAVRELRFGQRVHIAGALYDRPPYDVVAVHVRAGEEDQAEEGLLI